MLARIFWTDGTHLDIPFNPRQATALEINLGQVAREFEKLVHVVYIYDGCRHVLTLSGIK